MAYSVDQVRRLLRYPDNKSNLQDLARTVGLMEGGSTQAQHTAAVQFWSIALDQGYLSLGEEVAFAEAEIARHTKAMQPPKPGPKRVEPV